MLCPLVSMVNECLLKICPMGSAKVRRDNSTKKQNDLRKQPGRTMLRFERHAAETVASEAFARHGPNVAPPSCEVFVPSPSLRSLLIAAVPILQSRCSSARGQARLQEDRPVCFFALMTAGPLRRVSCGVPAPRG
jgi:hypothetical protein